MAASKPDPLEISKVVSGASSGAISSAVAAGAATPPHQGMTMSDAEKLIDSKIAASEARTDAKFARLDGKLDLVLSKVDNFDKRLSEQRLDIKADFRTSRTLTIAIAGLVLAAIAGAVTFGGTMFSCGMQIRDVVRAVAREQPIFQSMPTGAA